MLNFGRKKSILLATLGSEPQIITISLYHLEKILGKKIDEISVITTSYKNKQIKDAVSSLRKFFKESENFKNKRLEIIFSKREDYMIEDVSNLREIDTFVKTLYNKIKDLKRKNYKIDFLIAGGRKTMSIFSFLIASLIFDEDDKVWYLVSYEGLLKEKRFLPVNSDSYNLIELPLVQTVDISPIIIANGFSFERFIEEQKKRMCEKNLKQWKEFIISLTRQEEKVIHLMSEGYSNKQIASKMNVSVRTIEHHIQNVYLKFKATFLINTKISRSQFVSEIVKAKMSNITY